MTLCYHWLNDYQMKLHLIHHPCQIPFFFFYLRVWEKHYCHNYILPVRWYNGSDVSCCICISLSDVHTRSIYLYITLASILQVAKQIYSSGNVFLINWVQWHLETQALRHLYLIPKSLINSWLRLFGCVSFQHNHLKWNEIK